MKLTSKQIQNAIAFIKSVDVQNQHSWVDAPFFGEEEKAKVNAESEAIQTCLEILTRELKLCVPRKDT